jgi:hypothetical protein
MSRKHAGVLPYVVSVNIQSAFPEIHMHVAHWRKRRVSWKPIPQQPTRTSPMRQQIMIAQVSG